MAFLGAMPAGQHIHWRAPTAMVASLLAGAIFALGHHLFYSNLAAQKVPDERYNVAGVSVSPQQLNIAAGTSFAFLMKSCLVTAISVAYTQVMWKTTIGRSVPITTLDSMFSALGNGFHLLYLGAWRPFRLMVLLVLVAWSALRR